ncbi:hypothetical protein BC939DRAFT_78707 [Gamsiella multidivaricata]|uniref:uncharacterized protein n=1 Tax=Gamsiella multidivaricata TaxID=101098 RepID=UPI00221EEAED|nr:uncharacterized protein BC939DRAFT_78707 [Gamsiella multidivaricata]KAI7828072.1 hypothetical protein BC939DRAFT_78707 [Gamsiella multidivaricata]
MLMLMLMCQWVSVSIVTVKWHCASICLHVGSMSGGERVSLCLSEYCFGYMVPAHPPCSVVDSSPAFLFYFLLCRRAWDSFRQKQEKKYAPHKTIKKRLGAYMLYSLHLLAGQGKKPKQDSDGANKGLELQPGKWIVSGGIYAGLSQNIRR